VFQRDAVGFHHIEKGPEAYSVWSDTTAQFKWASGDLSFSWRSVFGAVVTILIDGKPEYLRVDVGEDWSRINLHLAPAYNGQARLIEFQVEPNKEPTVGARRLGVAIFRIEFVPANLNESMELGNENID